MLDNRPTMSVVSIAMLALLVMLPDAKAEILIDSFAAPSTAVVNTTAGDGNLDIDLMRSDPSILGVTTVSKSGNALDPGDSIRVVSPSK